MARNVIPNLHIMLRTSLLFIALSTLTITSACSKKGEGGGGGGGDKGAAVKLPKLGAELDLPGEITVSDGMSEVSHMLMGAEIGAMSVEIPKVPQTQEEAKSDADMFSPKNYKADKLADGYALTYDNTGGAGANFFVDVRRDLGGKTFKCGTTTNTAERQAVVLAACKSLRLAK